MFKVVLSILPFYFLRTEKRSFICEFWSYDESLLPNLKDWRKQGDLRSEGYHSCRTTHSWGWRLTFRLKAGPKSLGGGIWNRGLRFKGSSEGLDLNMTATYLLPKLRRAFHVALASRLAPIDLWPITLELGLPLHSFPIELLLSWIL